jgi:lipopolysaccharide assembly outer membrane protein LptD (OstA)
MRNVLIVALLVVAGAISGAAQGTSKGPVLPGVTKVTADKMQSLSPTEVVLSGNVTLVLPDATISADRVVVHQRSQTYELEGHVQLRPNPSTK